MKAYVKVLLAIQTAILVKIEARLLLRDMSLLIHQEHRVEN